MKKFLFVLFSSLLFSSISFANNIQMTNLSIVNNGAGNIQVRFDLSWDNSWRVLNGPANYDGGWVFFKYKNTSGLWVPLYLTGSNNSIPAGFDVYQTSDLQKVGAMISRNISNTGMGSVSITDVRLGAVNNLPYNIDISGFAIEMVYCPAPATRPFFGDGNGGSESVNAFHYADNTATTASVLPMKVDANAFDDAELDADGIFVYSNDTIQLTNPLGTLDPFPTMKALWCMKYEISQAGYRDFLNTLTVAQQTTRTTASPTSVIGTRVLPPTTTVRNYIEIKTPGTGSVPAVYGCDANNNNIYDEANDGEWVVCDCLNWADVAAYLDWSGLAPMSELQYERICRGNTSAGPQPAVYGEYAWGTSQIYTSIYVLSNAGAAGEVVTNNSGTVGNAIWNNTFPSLPEFGVVRNGIFATATSDRISSGASFFGVMEMTGNVSEYCITLGTVAGRSTRFVPNGDGNLSTSGNAQLTPGGPGFWPGMEGNITSSTANTCLGGCEVTGTAGMMVRGGNWISGLASTLAVSYRISALPTLLPRYEGYGGRGVLYLR